MSFCLVSFLPNVCLPRVRSIGNNAYWSANCLFAFITWSGPVQCFVIFQEPWMCSEHCMGCGLNVNDFQLQWMCSKHCMDCGLNVNDFQLQWMCSEQCMDCGLNVNDFLSPWMCSEHCMDCGLNFNYFDISVALQFFLCWDLLLMKIRLFHFVRTRKCWLLFFKSSSLCLPF